MQSATIPLGASVFAHRGHVRLSHKVGAYVGECCGGGRTQGHYLTGAGQTASPRAFYAVGGGSTMWMVDPDRDLTFVFLCAGLLDGLAHLQRLQRLSDLALAACID